MYTPTQPIELQVTCVRRKGNSHESITHLGGSVGTRWCWTVRQVVDALEARTHAFFVIQAGKRSEVRVVLGETPYLRASSAGRWTNGLLTMRACVPQRPERVLVAAGAAAALATNSLHERGG